LAGPLYGFRLYFEGNRRLISANGYRRFNIWEHSSTVKELYRRRCRREEPEMDSARQAASLLAPFAKKGQFLLDAGCGSGYFYHSVREMELDYLGVDASPGLIRIGQEEMPPFGCPAGKLMCARIEDLEGEVDHVVCLNVLSNLDNFHRPLERLLLMTRQTLILRESIWGNSSEYLYVEDKFLDPDSRLFVHVNTYHDKELMRLGERLGFAAKKVVDHRTQGKPELVIGYPHYWTFMLFQKTK
jgi:cyclopropane fatty-acyl-phospholipid synthase-like methyltransferase